MYEILTTIKRAYLRERERERERKRERERDRFLTSIICSVYWCVFIFVQTSLSLFCDRAFTGHTHSVFSIRRNPSPNTVGPVLKGHTKRISTFGFQAWISLNAGQKYCRMLQGELSAILLTYIKLSFVLKTFVMSICEWPLKFLCTPICVSYFILGLNRTAWFPSRINFHLYVVAFFTFEACSSLVFLSASLIRSTSNPAG